MSLNIIWFNRDLRLHDNPAIHSALLNCQNLFAIYIFDSTHPGLQHSSYHHQRFLLESIEDLDSSLQSISTRLHVFKGNSVTIFRYLHSKFGINTLSFTCDSEPAWQARYKAIEALSFELGFHCIPHYTQTLWNPMDVITANGGTAPTTFETFVCIVKAIGPPSFPVLDVDWQGVKFLNLAALEVEDFKLFDGVPSLRDIGLQNAPSASHERKIFGGERTALKDLAARLELESAAFQENLYQPNQARPNLLGPPMALSAAIAIGALSVRLFYWKVHDIYRKVYHDTLPPSINITGQLMWREFFYTVAREVPNFGQMADNRICLSIPWREDENLLDRWKTGNTGYPFIDAGLRQLKQEGWIHHTVRSALATFLTRGDLWISWEHGFHHFMNHLVDGDWCVGAGNWMWMSNSAFDRIENETPIIDPVLFGKRLEPSGDYIRRYVPELANVEEFEHIHEPWKAPLEVQKASNCIIGRDYPHRIVIHEEASKINRQKMFDFAHKLSDKRPETLPLNGKVQHLGDDIRQCFVTSEFCHHQSAGQPASFKHKVVSGCDSQSDSDRLSSGGVKVYIASSEGNPIPPPRVSPVSVITTNSSR